MKILFSSHTFYPNLGGLETVSVLLAREFAAAGQEVVVVTQSRGDRSEMAFPFEVVRRPSLRELVRLTSWADVVFHNNISLQVAWPLMFIQRPWVVAHHAWLRKGRDGRGMKAALKRVVLRKATGIAISRAIARDFATPCTLIPDPYDDDTFRLMPGLERDRDLVFVGRFVFEKGLPDLLDALVHLRSNGLTPTLTVIGMGPEEAKWRRLTAERQLTEQVCFVGPKRGRTLAEELNRNRVLVVPSCCNETFGMVALEAMACGCVVVGSQGGGLAEAIGPGGLTFPNGDVAVLAQRLKTALTDEEVVAACRRAGPAHLALHRPAEIAARYLEVFARAFDTVSHVSSA